jgi:hypothetical protein
MKLSDFRPHAGANLKQLIAIFRDKSWPEICPSALPDETLLQVVKDLRIVEAISTGDENAQEPPGAQGAITIAIFLVMSTLKARSESTGSGAVTSVSEDELPVLMRTYLRAVERTLISRILGDDAKEHDSDLAHVLDHVVAHPDI